MDVLIVIGIVVAAIAGLCMIFELGFKAGAASKAEGSK